MTAGPDPLKVDPVEVVTVDASGAATGTAPRRQAHTGEGQRHLAVSVVVLDARGRVLLQQRASEKPLFAGRWSNTVCTHPLPGESPAVAANRRLQEELGMACELEAAGTFSYVARDQGTGYIEHEFDHVFLGRSDAEPVPNRAEVSDVRWMDPGDLTRELEVSPQHFSPWLADVLRTAGVGHGPPETGSPTDTTVTDRPEARP